MALCLQRRQGVSAEDAHRRTLSGYGLQTAARNCECHVEASQDGPSASWNVALRPGSDGSGVAFSKASHAGEAPQVPGHLRPPSHHLYTNPDQDSFSRSGGRGELRAAGNRSRKCGDSPWDVGPGCNPSDPAHPLRGAGSLLDCVGHQSGVVQEGASPQARAEAPIRLNHTAPLERRGWTPRESVQAGSGGLRSCLWPR